MNIMRENPRKKDEKGLTHSALRSVRVKGRLGVGLFCDGPRHMHHRTVRGR